ncbi:hypothetical protein GQ42DRAFT_176307 [Ramicandelaber brevisporus]|nr:hypothetical protein GQ42DRAFT_176307 [Ramicandelaber brevisporus]
MTTLEKELRQRVNDHVATATVAQLRQILQLFEDPTAVNKLKPFRFLDLPYDLLEYTAEAFFTQTEATKALTVSKEFSQYFAKSIWRSFELTKATFYGCGAPLSFFRYGKHVRQLKVYTVPESFHFPGFFPNVQHVSFEINSSTAEMFDVYLEFMTNLRRITLSITDDSRDEADAAVNWINDKRHFLPNFISDRERVRLDLTAFEFIPEPVPQLLSAVLVKLDICQDQFDDCCGELNCQIFGGDETPVFPHLRELHLRACCDNSDGYDFSTFKSDRFPALRSLAIKCHATPCFGEDQFPLAAIFAKPWPSITKFELSGEGTSLPDVGLYLRAMPNLRHCYLRRLELIHMESILAEMKQVKELTFDGCSYVPTKVRKQLPNLEKLKIVNIVLDECWCSSVMAAAPRLARVELVHCELTDSALPHLSDLKAQSVTQLIINGSEPQQEQKIDPIIQIFPNLKLLDITSVEEERKLDMLKHYRNLSILA